MTSKDFFGIAITVALALALVVMSIFLILGKGAHLISGYNTMPTWEKKRFDEKALCKFVGKILLPIGILMPLISIGAILKIGWIVSAYGVLVVVLVIFAVIYCNTGGRFKV